MKETIVFTNGCFDILHYGHILLLKEAKKLGDKLIVGLNSDNSIRRLKGYDRPIILENERKNILLELKCVDDVIIFDDLTPIDLIKRIRPDFLVKGGDWGKDNIVGKDFVELNGGKVITIPITYKNSTTKIIERIIHVYRNGRSRIYW